MLRFLAVLHAVAVLAVLSLCLVLASETVSYFGHETFAHAYQRSAVALLCGLFAIAHVYLLARGRLTIGAALLFYPLCLLLGLVSNLVANGSAKNWAPSTATEAFYSNVIGYGLLGVLVAVSAGSCYWALARGRRNNA
jgi:cell division protein FtsW (lipid II flippase)